MSDKSFIDDILIWKVREDLKKDLKQFMNYWREHPIFSEIRFNGRLLFNPHACCSRDKGLIGIKELREIQPNESYVNVTNFNEIIERYVNKKAREKAEELVNKINTGGIKNGI